MEIMSTQEKIIEIIASICDVNKNAVNANSTIGDFPGWDSMGQLSILQKVEEEFGISFEPEEMMELEDVSDIVKAVEAKLQQQ